MYNLDVCLVPKKSENKAPIIVSLRFSRFVHVGLDLAPEFGKGKSHSVTEVH